MIDGYIYKYENDQYYYLDFGTLRSLPILGQSFRFMANSGEMQLGLVEATDYTQGTLSVRTTQGWYTIRYYEDA
jgi:hypothetical protein